MPYFLMTLTSNCAIGRVLLDQKMWPVVEIHKGEQWHMTEYRDNPDFHDA
jgi:hypothetical protein